ncbi:MAG TPA: hypothetical protein VF021_01075 [Longimicrobiales bacterium]
MGALAKILIDEGHDVVAVTRSLEIPRFPEAVLRAVSHRIDA